MPAAACKDDLLATTRMEWGKLQKLLSTVPPELQTLTDAEGSSVKDVLAHRAHWIGLFFQWLEEGRDGGPVAMPDHGVKWNQLKTYNARLRKDNTALSREEVIRWLSQAHDRLVEYLSEADEAVLYGDPMPGGTGWTIGRYGEAAGSSHYRSAAKFIRARIRKSRM